MLACIGLFSYCGVNLTQTCPVKTWTCKEKYRMIFVFPQVPLQSVQNSSVSQRRFASNCCTGCFLKDHIHHLKKKTFNLARTSCLHVHWQFTIHTNFISVSMEIKVPNFVYFLALTCSTAHAVKRHDVAWVYSMCWTVTRLKTTPSLNTRGQQSWHLPSTQKYLFSHHCILIFQIPQVLKMNIKTITLHLF